MHFQFFSQNPVARTLHDATYFENFAGNYLFYELQHSVPQCDRRPLDVKDDTDVVSSSLGIVCDMNNGIVPHVAFRTAETILPKF